MTNSYFFSTSGLTQLGGVPPAMQRRRYCRPRYWPSLAHLQTALPRCGVSTTFFIASERRRHFRLMLEHVEAGAGDLLLLQRAHQRLLVDDGAARGVDDEGRRLHLGELRVADHDGASPALSGGCSETKSDSRQQLVERHIGPCRSRCSASACGAAPNRARACRSRARAAPSPCRCARRRRSGRWSCRRHDGAERDGCDCEPGNLPARTSRSALHHAARHHEHQAEMDVGGRLRHDRRHHGDRDAAPGRFGDVDIGGRDRLRADARAVSDWRRSRRGRSCRAAGKPGCRPCVTPAIRFVLGDDAGWSRG